MPTWIKNNVKQWSSNSEIIDGIKQMVKEKIINSPKEYPNSERVVPDWIKNNAKWWYNGQISDDDFIKSLQYLVNKGIIRV